MNTDEVIIDDIFIINKKAKHTLAECLSCYSKDVLKILAATKKASDNSDILTLKKTEIVAELEKSITEKSFYTLTTTNLMRLSGKTLRKTQEKTLSKKCSKLH